MRRASTVDFKIQGTINCWNKQHRYVSSDCTIYSNVLLIQPLVKYTDPLLIPQMFGPIHPITMYRHVWRSRSITTASLFLLIPMLGLLTELRSSQLNQTIYFPNHTTMTQRNTEQNWTRCLFQFNHIYTAQSWKQNSYT